MRDALFGGFLIKWFWFFYSNKLFRIWIFIQTHTFKIELIEQSFDFEPRNQFIYKIPPFQKCPTNKACVCQPKSSSKQQ